MRTTEPLAIHNLNVLRIQELETQLNNPGLNQFMLEAIMSATVDGCVRAYVHEDFESGDALAELNGRAERLWRAQAAQVA
jgi:hypothetical protein